MQGWWGRAEGDRLSVAPFSQGRARILINARTRSERAQSRFSKERDSDKALSERQKCLVKLAAAGDIPPEVLMSLPSPEQIHAAPSKPKPKRRPPSPFKKLMMLPPLVFRTLRSANARCVWKFAWNFGFKGFLSVEKFKRRIKRGEYFPPFLYLSILNTCNLRCQGCWVDVESKDAIDLAALNRTILDAKKHGNAFFGILGGEPFMHPQLLDLFDAHPDCYFQVFTNGQLITEKAAARMLAAGNVTPLISIEGREIVSDERRGKKDVYARTLRGLDNCIKAGLLTGVATSVCRTNIDDLTNRGSRSSSTAACTTRGITVTAPSARNRISTSPSRRSNSCACVVSSPTCAQKCPSRSSTPTTTTMAAPFARCPPASVTTSVRKATSSPARSFSLPRKTSTIRAASTRRCAIARS